MKIDPVEISLVDIDSLIPYARNARKHSDLQVAEIAASIKEFGWTVPVLISEDGGIIAGHGRILAARMLGIDQIPAIQAADWSDAQKRAYILADNKLTLNGEWDLDLLKIEISDLIAEGFDMDLTGFSEEEIEKLLPEALDELPDLAEGDREPFRQATFTLHDSQFEEVESALKRAKEMGGFDTSVNENSNGNALARICEIFLTQNGRAEDERGEG